MMSEGRYQELTGALEDESGPIRGTGRRQYGAMLVGRNTTPIAAIDGVSELWRLLLHQKARETVMSRRQAKKAARRRVTAAIPAAPGRVIEVCFRANIIVEKFRSVHVEATSTVGLDEEPATALERARDVVKAELLRVKGQVDMRRQIADDNIIDAWGDGD